MGDGTTQPQDVAPLEQKTLLGELGLAEADFHMVVRAASDAGRRGATMRQTLPLLSALAIHRSVQAFEGRVYRTSMAMLGLSAAILLMAVVHFVALL